MANIDLWPINPEFKRNLWLSLSLERLIAMPIILAAVLWVDAIYSNPQDVSEHILYIILFFLVVWGSSNSADSIFVELRNRTWESQRMTPTTPWEMTWGKLLGSTVFVWYGTLCCLVALFIIDKGNYTRHVLFENAELGNGGAEKIELGSITNFYRWAYYLLTGFFSQAFAMFVALLFQRISPIFTRARVVYIQIFTIAAAIYLFYSGKDLLPAILQHYPWFNLNVSIPLFILTSQIFFIGWTIFGIYRLMRVELLYRNYPWGLGIFIIFWSFYIMGFFYGINAKDEKILSVDTQFAYTSIAFLSAVLFTFCGAFFSPKNKVFVNTISRNISEKSWLKALQLFPTWLLGLLISLIFLILVVYFAQKTFFTQLPGQETLDYIDKLTDIRLRIIAFSVSIFLFLIRDIGILYLLNAYSNAKPRNLASVVYLVVLYILLPILLHSLNLKSYWLPLIAPWVWFLPIGTIDYMHLAVIFIGIILQIIVIGYFLIRQVSTPIENNE